MKNIKTEYIVLGLIIIVLSAYLAFHRDGSDPVDLPGYTDISSMDITKLTISKTGNTLSISKKNGAWVLGEEGFPADEAQINAMVANIKDLKITALVSESKDYSRYDLDDAHKIRVTAFSNDKAVRTFDLGKTASSYRHTFMKFENDPRVFHAEQNFREAFDKQEIDLTQKTVLSLAPDSTTRIEGNVEKTPFVFGKKKEEVKEGESAKDEPAASKTDDKKAAPSEPKTRELWTDPSGKELDVTKVSGFLNLFSSLSCVNYIKGAKKEDYADPLIQITLTGAKPSSLSIYSKKEGTGYPAVSSDTPFPFLLPDEKIEEIKAKITEIKG